MATPGHYIQLAFDGTPPERLYTVQRMFGAPELAPRCPHGNFTKGVKWSSDGACLLTASDDALLRVFDLPHDAMAAHVHEEPTNGEASAVGTSAAHSPVVFDGSSIGAGTAPYAPADDGLQPAVVVDVGETIYDFAWYPRMHVSDPASCCFASSARAHPIHVWDAVTGELRCTYRRATAA